VGPGWWVTATASLRNHDPRPTTSLREEFSVAILNHMVQYQPDLDTVFTAVADPTRRGILERLGRRDASISELAEAFDMTLTGMKKHVRVLEDAGLVRTEKVGRVRTCRLGPRRLADEAAWIARYQAMLEARLDSLGAFLERTKGDDR
jgi:DNA-binding transcriptional ArsR family regulator